MMPNMAGISVGYLSYRIHLLNTAVQTGGPFAQLGGVENSE